jgi:hypothetical protein
MLTKSEKLVWAAAYAQTFAKESGIDAAKMAYAAVMALRLTTFPTGERNWEPAKMLNSMREMKP